jgi:hypothetical protein
MSKCELIWLVSEQNLKLRGLSSASGDLNHCFVLLGEGVETGEHEYAHTSKRVCQIASCGRLQPGEFSPERSGADAESGDDYTMRVYRRLPRGRKRRLYCVTADMVRSFF